MQFAFGSGLLYATPLVDANGNAISNPTPLLLGVLQDCAVNLALDTKSLYGQNQFPVDIGRGKGKLTGKARAAQLQAQALNTLMFGQTVVAGQTSVVHDTTGAAIPTTPFTITPTVPGSGTWASDLGVRDANGIPYTRVASGPATGQYSVASGVYTFAAADTTKIVYIDFTYTLAATGKKLTVANLVMGEIPQFQGEIFFKKGGKGTYLKVPNFVCSKLALASKQDDYLVPDFDFEGFADASGNVLYWSSVE